MLLPGLSPARRRFVLAFVGLVAAGLVAVLVLVGVRALTGGADPVAQDEKGPVLLVSGYGGSVAALEPLRAALVSAGRTVVVVPALDGGTGDLDAQAAALGRAALDALRGRDGSVDVVGYSAGGVVARLWVRDHGGASLARRVVSVGSPQHGTGVAGLAVDAAGGCPTACEQLVPDSALLRRLNAGDETPSGPAFVSVWSTADEVVTPPDSARLDGALDLAVQDVCPGAGTSHGQLPSDPVVLAGLTTFLGPGPPEAPGPSVC